MALFQPKPNIHLSTEEEEESSTSRRPSAFSRKPSNWSIPCCSHISLGKSRGRIQLPEDSDNDESADEDFNQPAPFNTNINHSENLPNAFLQAQAKSQTSLSRNPFARVSFSIDEEELQYQKNKRINREVDATTEERQIDSFMPEGSGEEELANFTRSSFTRYDDEPDWTESYKDDDEDSVKSFEAAAAATSFQIKTDEDDTKTNLSQDILNTQTTTTNTSINIPNEQDDDTSSITTTTTTTTEDVIPQIEKEVLHLLPLPRLSKEIPPTMIHKKPSFEKSMYGEQPLMSVDRRSHGSKVSRFSMTEHDYLTLKKAEEEKQLEKRISSLDVAHTTSTSAALAAGTKELSQDDPLGGNTVNDATTKEQDVQQQTRPLAAQVKDDRRASIAQSLLGDKLDDFTEKLAFIKKNIIMSIDSDEEDDDDEEISAENILKKIEKAKSNSAITTSSDQRPPPTLHRRTSSLMDAVPTIARFMNQIGGGSNGGNTTPEANSTAQLSSSQTSTSSFSPSSLFSALAGPMPEPSASNASLQQTTTTTKKMNEKRSIQEEGEEEEEGEELFDFHKVLEIGKNVKTFGEGFVGNGMRMLNDVATRVKTTVEEEQKRAAAEMAAQKNESTSTASSTNENEWMHNYL